MKILLSLHSIKLIMFTVLAIVFLAMADTYSSNKTEARQGSISIAKEESNNLDVLIPEQKWSSKGDKVMSAQQQQRTKYGFSRTVKLPFDAAIEKTRGALKEEGFGVLSEIDIKDKLKEKLNVDFRRYTILGACNPSLAYKTLQEELEIGLLLPCNVIVYEAEDKNMTVISAVDAKAMLSVVGNNATLDQVASEVNERLQRVVRSI